MIAPGRAEKFTLFVRPRDPERETWTGRRAGVEGARAEVRRRPGLPRRRRWRASCPSCSTAPTRSSTSPATTRELDELVLDDARRTCAQASGAACARPRRIGDLRWTLHELRLHQGRRRRSARCAAPPRSRAEAHIAAMRAARDGVNEYEIEALIDYTFRRHGGLPGYGTIVGGGVNATILHYVDNDAAAAAGRAPARRRRLRDRRLHRRRHAHLSRSARASRRRSGAATSWCSTSRRRCIAAVKPGRHHRRHPRAGGRAAHARAWSTSACSAGDVRRAHREAAPTSASTCTAPRTGSAWTCTTSAPTRPTGESRPLEPGMVLTVEPGLYIAEDAERRRRRAIAASASASRTTCSSPPTATRS